MAELIQRVSTVNVNIDGQDYGIVPSSLAFKEGKPTRDVKGLDNGDVIFSENREEAVGMIKFELPTTPENLANAKTLNSRLNSTVRFTDDYGTERVMVSGVTKNDSERTTGPDGKIALEYIGTPLD